MYKAKILVVDDEVDTLNLTRIVLETEGYEVETAKDCKEAFDKIVEGKPDMILLDIRLPGMNGFEMCRQLKSQMETKSIPIVMFTASGSKRIKKEVHEIGANGFLLKPFNIDKLIEVVKTHLGDK